mmetsp:Transcript_41727/g.163741  ORF Transcript_41727/g.163741 Transcript_41727/m.163741 type:complete len:236 (-) Transcript_41727:607-1314(-)
MSFGLGSRTMWCEFGRYLGEGSTAHVVEGRIGSLNVAVKCIRRNSKVHTDGYYLSEIESLKRIGGSHPNVVRLQLVYEDTTNVYVCMNDVRGYHPEPGADRGVAAGLVHCLQHLRESGVVHRDIAARNILVEPSGNPVLIDFGFACPAGVVADPFPPLENLPPELQEFTGRPAHAAEDIFALGVLIRDLYPADEAALSLADAMAVCPMHKSPCTRVHRDPSVSGTSEVCFLLRPV